MEKFIFFIGFATEILPQEKIAIDVLLALEETLAALILNSFSIPDHLKLQLKPLVFDLHAFLKKYPHTQDYLLSAFGYLAGKNKPNYLSNAIAFLAASKEIIKILDTATNNSFEKENQLIFYGLLAHFAQKPTGLIDLLTSIKKLTSLPKQHFVLQLISRLLSNKQSIDGFTAFIDALSDDHVYEIMASECAIPPYPDIQTLTTWLREDNFTQRYATYSAKPYGERRQDYRFALAEASQKKTAFLGVADDLFQEDLLVEIDSLLESNRKLLPRELRVSIDVLRKQSDERELTKPEIITLLCCCIEMLAKTTPQLDPQPAVLDSKLIISQELNTTQVMALVAMLLGRASIAQNEMISEIKAGEGKSRIMMLLAACFSLQGKTIDFITQNMMLAERDYFSYQMFFVALGIKTSLISLGTPKQLYQVGGINFSDSSFLLLQNKSDIDRLQGAYVDPDPKKRYLLLDEVDAFIYSEDPFNYAGCSLKLNDFVWVYSYLVSFVRECLSAQQTITKNGFLGSLISKGIDPTQFAALKNLDGADNKQIESWLQAAQTALKMRLGELYDVTEPGDANLIVVRDHEGRTRYTRKVEVLKNGRPQERCSFMGGVQQCLAVMQNQEIDKVQNNITDGEDSFVILPEHATQRAIFPTTFIEQRYGQGMVYGASGTTRSDAEREHPEIKDPKRQYIIVPRHKISRRVDKNILAANGQAQHIVFIKRSILAVIAKHPVLLICRDDNQSQIFFNALINDEDFKREIRQIQRIHARTLIKDEKQSIKDSAKIGCVTIATVGMCGRGVDIEADHLIVLLAYVATPWDEEQVKGRTARIGKPGEYRVIIDITDPVCVLNGKTHNIHSQVIAAQYNLELRAIVSWEMTNLYADFLERCHQKFLTAYGESADPHDLLQRWIVFLAQILIEWSTVKKQLLLFVEPGQNIEASIACFKKFIQQYMDKIPQTDENHCAQVDFNNGDIKPYFQRAQYRKEIFQQHKPKIIIQQKYDPADDGQARIYSTLFAQTKAVLRGERRWFADYHAWREGRGVLFPDLTALFKGERPLFANLKTTMHQYFNAASTKPARKLSAQNSKKISASGVNKFFQQHGKKIVFMALITSGFTALSVLTFGATAILPAIYIIYAAYGAGGILGAGLLSYGGLRLMKKVAPGAKKFTQAISNSVVAKNKDRSVEKSKTIGLPEAVERAQYLIHCVNDYNKRLGQDYKKELAKIISQLAAHLNTIRVNESDTLLHWAVYCENVYAVDLLINQGADPSIKNGQGQIAADLITAERTFVNANMLDLLKKVDVQPPDSTLTNTTQSNLSIANYNPLYVPAHVFASATTVSLQPLLSADIDQEDGYVVNPSLAPAG